MRKNREKGLPHGKLAEKVFRRFDIVFVARLDFMFFLK
jgi:hypothetical protein